MPSARRLLQLTALAAGLLQIWLAVSRDGPFWQRALPLGIGLAVWVWSRSRRSATSGDIERLLVVSAACGAFWIGALEVLLSHFVLMARGALLLSTAVLVHVAALYAGLRQRDPAARIGGWILQACVFATVALGTLAVLESVARVTSPLRTYELIPDDPAAGPCLTRGPAGRLVGRPGCSGRYIHREFDGVRAQFNGLGLRDGLDETSPPSPDEVSVLVLGDSFGYGMGVELADTFQERLEVLATEKMDEPVRVYGAAMPGSGTVHERHVLEELGPRLSPDVVVLALFEGNDLQDNWAARERETSDEPAGEADAEPTAPARFLRALLSARFWQTSSALLQIRRPDGRPTRAMALALETTDHPRISEMRQALIEEVLEIERISRELGGRLVILVVPTIIQAEPQRFEEFLERRDDAASSYDRTRFHRQLVDDLRTEGLRVVDPMDRLESELAAGRAAYHREGHWNERGHSVAAALLAAALAEREADDTPVPRGATEAD